MNNNKEEEVVDNNVILDVSEEVTKEEVFEEVKKEEVIVALEEYISETGGESSREEEDNTKYDTLVLPGGSIKGLIVLGSLQYCYDNYLLNDIVNYVGTSSGAMTSFFLAIGYTPVEIISSLCTSQVMERMQHFDIFAMVNNLGALSFTNISECLEKMTIDKIGYLPTFYDIKHKFNKNLVCVTYNITKGEAEYISYDTHPTLPCLVAIRMTSNLPLIFENYKYSNNYYIDGGIVDNFAIDKADDMGKKVLGINIVFDIAKFSSTDNVLEYIYKLMYIPIRQQQKSKIDKVCPKKCTIISVSDLSAKSTFNFSITTTDKLDMFSSGYRQIKKIIEN